MFFIFLLSTEKGPDLSWSTENRAKAYLIVGKTTAGPPFLDKTLWEQTLRLKPRRGENIMKKAIALLLTFVTLLSFADAKEDLAAEDLHIPGTGGG